MTKTIYIIGIIAVVAVIGFLIFYFYSKKGKTAEIGGKAVHPNLDVQRPIVPPEMTGERSSMYTGY